MPYPAIRTLLTLFLLASVLLPSASAHAAPDRRNAATWYQRAIDGIQHLSIEETRAVEAYLKSPHGAVPPGVRNTLSRAGAAISNAHRGSRQAYCDYRLDYTQGYELQLPHLGALRMVAKLMAARGYVALHDGDSSAAAVEVAALYRIGEHIPHDQILISTLVGTAIAALADRLASAGFDNGRFSPRDSRTILNGLGALPSRDPFHTVDALVSEQEMVVDWLVDRFGDQAERQQMYDDMEWLAPNEETAAAFADLSNEAFTDEVARYDVMMDEVADIFTLEDEDQARAELEDFEARHEAGEFGLIATIVTPALGHVYERMLKSTQMIEERRVMLEEVADGERDVTAELNAALFYRQAMERLREAEPEAAARIANASISEDDLDDTARALRDAVLALVAEAASKPRCTLSLLRTAQSSPVCPADLAGMQQIVQVLIAAEDRDPTGSIEPLALLLHMARHMESDEPILTALIAHNTFKAAATRVERRIAGTVSDEAARRLLDAAQEIGRVDPFGYLGAMKRRRRSIQSRLYRCVPLFEKGSDALNQAHEQVGQWTGDQLLYMQVVFESDAWTAQTEAEGVTEAERTEPFDAVGESVDPVAVSAARSESAAVMVRVNGGEWSLFEQHVFLPIAPIEEHRTAARRDLRSLVSTLRRLVKEHEAAAAEGAGDGDGN